MHSRLVKNILFAFLAIAMAGLAKPTPAHAAWFPNQWSPLWWLNNTASTPQPKIVPEEHFLPSVSQSFVQKAVAMEDRKVVAGWLTPWGDDSYNSFKNNLDKLTEIHPFVYTIASDGVSIDPDQGDWHKEDVLKLARDHNIAVIPTISGDVNYSDLMLNDPAKQTAHINELVRLVEDNGYDGIDIDYEGFMNGYNRDVYAQFMTDLSKELKARHKTLGIAVEAFNTQQNWEVFGQVVDRFEIMGYDYHSAKTTDVGPIGPANWLHDVIDYAATRVPKSKIVLGLGTYGYSWISDGSQYVSEAVSYDDALSIASDTGSTIEHDADNTPHFSYNRGYGQRYLYFEDAQSTKPKLSLVNETGIAGIAFWRLGTEDPKIWDDVAQLVK